MKICIVIVFSLCTKVLRNILKYTRKFSRTKYIQKRAIIRSRAYNQATKPTIAVIRNSYITNRYLVILMAE